MEVFKAEAGFASDYTVTCNCNMKATGATFSRNYPTTTPRSRAILTSAVSGRVEAAQREGNSS